MKLIQMLKILSSFYFFIFLLHSFCHAEDQRKTINIITLKNGKGLEKDFNILDRELTKIGYKVNYVNMFENQPPPFADINLFLETGNEYFFPFALKNYLIPNPEWYACSPQVTAKFDLILCKTRESERIFSQMNPNTKFISFTCDPSVNFISSTMTKNYKLSLHFSGSSYQKGTASVESVWLRNLNFPTLYLLKFSPSRLASGHNIMQINGYIPPFILMILQNTCGIHICPSETEGFGHILLESMSTEAVVVTTDAPPMNEYITDKRCLVSYDGKGSQCLSTTYYADPLSLEKKMLDLFNMPEEELMKIGKQNRKFYLENDAFFKRQLAEIFKINKEG